MAETDTYDDMLLPDLRRLAKDRGIVASRLPKPEVVARLREADGRTAAPVLPELTADGTDGPLPPLPDDAYPPDAQPLEPTEPEAEPGTESDDEVDGDVLDEPPGPLQFAYVVPSGGFNTGIHHGFLADAARDAAAAGVSEPRAVYRTGWGYDDDGQRTAIYEVIP